MLAVMTVAVKVDVAAAAAAAAAVGMLATILVLLVASLPFTCLLQQLEPTLSWNSSFSKRKKRQKNSPLGNRRLKSALVFTKMFRIITNTPRSNFSKMRDHRKAQKKTWKCKFALVKNYLFTKMFIARKTLIWECSNHHQRLQNVFLYIADHFWGLPHTWPGFLEDFPISLRQKWKKFISQRN